MRRKRGGKRVLRTLVASAMVLSMIPIGITAQAQEGVAEVDGCMGAVDSLDQTSAGGGVSH